MKSRLALADESLFDRPQNPEVDLDWALLRASQINDAGWIVDNGLLDGNAQAFLLVPVPEPNAAVLMAMGATCAALVMPANSGVGARHH